MGKEKNIPAKLNYEMSLAYNRAYSKWLEAKQAADFSMFSGALAEIISYTHQALDLREQKKPTYYDALLDDTEKGGSISQLDAFLTRCARGSSRWCGAFRRRASPSAWISCPARAPFRSRRRSPNTCWNWRGWTKEALVLMTTEHPFTTNFGPKDVRVTTHYYENNFVSNIFTTLHEGGHALFMQNEPEEFYREHAANSMTNGMHECISRFYENLIGRSEAFVHFIYPKLQELSGGTFADVSERQLYEAVNAAAPGLNRCDADELTYCLHIMIRYELEKAFMNGEITVDEIPALWNQKYQDYLGVTVPDDAQGLLAGRALDNACRIFPVLRAWLCLRRADIADNGEGLRCLYLRGKGRSAPHP